MKKPNTTPASPSVIKPVYSWEVFTEVSNANSFTACDIIGYIFGNPRCLGDQVNYLMDNGVVVDFLEGTTRDAVTGAVTGSSTSEEDEAVERWLVEKSCRTLSTLHNPRSMLDTALLLVHCGGGLEMTLTQEKGKPPFSYRFVGNPEDYLPVMWVRTLPSKVRIKIRALWESSDEGYTDYFDRRDLALLKGWLTER